jgi:acetyl esterase/lipase
MTRLIATLLVLLLAMAMARAQADVPKKPPAETAHPPAIVLWPEGAPGSQARRAEPEQLAWREESTNHITFPVLFNIHNPSIVPFIPRKARATGAAVIIAPGGGHMFLTIDREGYDLGKWLAEHGIAAFVLKYRLARDQAGNSPYQTDPDALADAKRAVRVIRSRAGQWGIDPQRIGFLGFSAGGQLAGMLALQADAGDPAASDTIEKASSQPNFLGFIYGGPYKTTDFTSTPIAPSFLLCAYDDPNNAENIANLFIRLRAAKVPAELHVYGAGGHGFGVRHDRSLSVENWPAQFTAWLKDTGMLGAAGH